MITAKEQQNTTLHHKLKAFNFILNILHFTFNMLIFYQQLTSSFTNLPHFSLSVHYTVKLVQSWIASDRLYFYIGQVSALYRINNTDYRICSHWASFRLITFRHGQVLLPRRKIIVVTTQNGAQKDKNRPKTTDPLLNNFQKHNCIFRLKIV
jgi:hypothetical protein